MKKLTTAVVLLSSMLLLGGCTSSIHLVNTAGFDQPMPTDAEPRYLVAEAEKNVILGFSFDTDYVDEARESLIAQCDGDLVAVSTQYYTEHDFLHWTNKILMKGICI